MPGVGIIESTRDCTICDLFVVPRWMMYNSFAWVPDLHWSFDGKSSFVYFLCQEFSVKVCPRCKHPNEIHMGICRNCGVSLIGVNATTINASQVFNNDCLKSTDIQISDIMVPGDALAIGWMDKLSPIKASANLILKHINIPMLESNFLGNAIRLSPTQLPRIYNIMLKCANSLNIQAPNLYIIYDPSYNAITYGTDKEHFIVLHSSLVNDFSEPELEYIIGHEMGHIKCGHVLYSSAYTMIVGGLLNIPFSGVLSIPMMSAWMREAELSADRAGLIACMNLPAAIKSMLRMTVGMEDMFPEINLKELLTQLDDMSPLHSFLQRRNESHPYTIKRIKELIGFALAPQHRLIFEKSSAKQGRKLHREESLTATQAQSLSDDTSSNIIICPDCDSINNTADKECVFCGTKLT